MREWIKVKNKTIDDDFFYMNKNSPRKYIEGIEYVQVKRNQDDIRFYLMRRDSLVTSWK